MSDKRNNDRKHGLFGQELLHSMKSIAAFAAVGLLLYLFTFYLDGEMGIILMAFVIFAPLVSYAMAAYARKRIKVHIDCEGYVQKGSTLDVKITVEKTGIVPLAIVELVPKATEVFSGWDKKYHLSLAGAEKKSFHCPAEAVIAGNGEISIPEIYSCGFLGFMKLLVKNKEQYPDVKSVGVIPALPEVSASSQLFRSIADGVMSSDEEENDTAMQFSTNTSPGYVHREYVEGDPLKRVNWKLSSKKNKLMVRLDEAVASVQPVMVLDLYRSSSEDPVKSAIAGERIICSMFGLLDLLVKQGIACTFVYRGEDGSAVCENADNADAPSQLLMKVLAVRNMTDVRVGRTDVTSQACACVFASTDFGGDFSQLTAGIEDPDSSCLLAPAADTPNPTKLSMWYLDGDNNFKKMV
ncbi:MAG: DUF58 domain-containing protein [Ruminococcus sp.]|nr:DUF58 domain-containing protein [Ruminococcus sp.]